MINILHNEKQRSRNAFIMRSVLHNVNAITLSILSKGAEQNATVRLTFCTTLLMISNQCTNAFILYNVLMLILASILLRSAVGNATIRAQHCL